MDRNPDKKDLEIYEHYQRMKEISAFHYKELLIFKNHSDLNVYWQWNHFGTMIYYRAPKELSMPGCISIDMMWFSISSNFNQKSLFT